MKLLNIANKVIEYSFYLIFFLVPLALTGDTSELFEFNKLWLTFVLTIVVGAAWITKMIVRKEFRLQRTPLDIPIAIFLVAQIISTIFSMDTHVSLWGYYSRFNGGLYSIFAYVFLFYAFVSNFKDINENQKENKFSLNFLIYGIGLLVFFVGIYISSLIKSTEFSVIPFQMFATLTTALAAFFIFLKAAPSGFMRKTFYTILSSALLVVLWGLPSHFGFDPTCLLFRGTFDVSCWTADFQPQIRIFSTLGQPDWLASYIAILIPVLFGLFFAFVKGKNFVFKKFQFLKNKDFYIAAILLIFLSISYLSLLYSGSRSIIAAFWLSFAALVIYFLIAFVKPKLSRETFNVNFKLVLSIVIVLYAITFFAGQPFSQLHIFTLKGIQEKVLTPPKSQTQVAKEEKTKQESASAAPVTELGGTDSGKIRLYVWEGAIDIWKHNLLFGSGLETYAYAYYQYRPAGHNLTSEWKFLYNKAHNEYLNYLATTGTVGIVAYLLMIGSFVFLSIRYLKKKIKNPTKKDFVIASIFFGYTTILIGNFFGFSVVMVNILFYLIPAFVFLLAGIIDFDKSYTLSFAKNEKLLLISRGQKIFIGVNLIFAIILLYFLAVFWTADRYYYLGSNFDNIGDYQTAYGYLQKSVELRPGEPVFRDELALNNAVLASAIIYQNQQSPTKQNEDLAKKFLQAAVTNSDRLVKEHPNNVVFWKKRVRIFYTLAQVDATYVPLALNAVEKTAELAPTDPDVSYNLGVLTGESGNFKKAIEILNNTVKLKPDYSNAYFALGIFYHQISLNDKGQVANRDYLKKAIDEMQFVLDNFGQNDQAQAAIDAWTKELR